MILWWFFPLVPVRSGVTQNCLLVVAFGDTISISRRYFTDASEGTVRGEVYLANYLTAMTCAYIKLGGYGEVAEPSRASLFSLRVHFRCAGGDNDPG